MQDISYPSLRIGVLRALQDLKRHYTVDPEIFQRSDCPYDSDVRAVLEEILKVETVEKIVEKRVVHESAGSGKRGPRPKLGLNEADQELVSNELSDLLDELKKMNDPDKDLDQSAKLAVFKLKVAIIESIVKLRERVLNIKRLAGFEAVVISILDDLVSEDDREVFLERIAPYRED